METNQDGGQPHINVINYCMGAKPLEKLLESNKDILEEVHYVDLKRNNGECIHVGKNEVEETIPLLDKNVHYIASQLQLETIREDWKSTRENYSKIDDSKCIDYNNSVIAAYSIGTTPIHVFLLRHLITTYIKPIVTKPTINSVCLCGGSGAELISFVLSYNHSSIQSMHITIIDKEPLWKSTLILQTRFIIRLDNIYASLQPITTFKLQFEFISLDLLSSSSYTILSSYLKSADICTIVYGISELLDYDDLHTTELLTVIKLNMKKNSLIMIVDPLSHQFCCEKEVTIRDKLLYDDLTMNSISKKQKSESVYKWSSLYERHDKIAVTRSILEPYLLNYCSLLNLQINRDIKLSCHTWCLILKCNEMNEHSVFNSEDETPLSNKSVNTVSLPLQASTCVSLPHYNTILFLTQLQCISSLSPLLSSLHITTNLWLPRDFTDDLNIPLYTRLLLAWKQYGGILCLPYTIFFQLMKLLKIDKCDLLVFHNYDSYIETEKKTSMDKVPLFQEIQKMQFSRLAITIQRSIQDKEGKEMYNALQQFLENQFPRSQFELISCTSDDVMTKNKQRGIQYSIETIHWNPTPLQTQLLSASTSNNLQSLILIHPALLNEKFVKNNKQYKKEGLQELQRLISIHDYDMESSERITFVINTATQLKKQHKQCAILFRLLPSLNAVQNAIEFYNKKTSINLTFSTILPFKKTQFKTQYKQSQIDNESDILLVHLSCIPYLEMDRELDTIILFDSVLGNEKVRETINDAIADFCRIDRKSNFNVRLL